MMERPLTDAVIGVGRFHDVGATIYHAGRVSVVAEAERVLDLKHARGPRSVAPAVEAALRESNLAAGDIAAVIVADTHGDAIECRPDYDTNSSIRGWDTVDPAALSVTHGPAMLLPLGRAALCDARLRMGDLGISGLRDETPVFGVCHHAAHAASAIYMSGFEDCAVLVADGYGVCNGTMAYRYRDGRCDRLEEFRDAALLGWRYGLFGHLAKEIDSGSTDNLDLAGKVMGLNAYGVPREDLVAAFESWFHEDYQAYGKVYDRERIWFTDILGGSGLTRDQGSVHDPRFLDIVASMQEAFSNVMCDLARRALAATESRSLALAGGCALNVLANERIANLPGLDKLFVLPNAGDSGLPMGAAVIGGSRLSGQPLHHPALPVRVRRNPFLGISLVEDLLIDDIPPSLSSSPASDPANIVRIVDLLCRNGLVGIAVGRCEIGPRALGNRSILANGMDPVMRDVLNQVKRREWWRPFAPVCRACDADRFFTGKMFSEYMLTSVRVKPEYQSVFSAAAHEDGTARLQIIPERDAHPLLWDILTEFDKRTQIGVLINTSFNLGGKPLLNRTSTAVGMVADNKLDAVLTDKHFFWK